MRQLSRMILGISLLALWGGCIDVPEPTKAPPGLFNNQNNTNNKNNPNNANNPNNKNNPNNLNNKQDQVTALRFEEDAMIMYPGTTTALTLIVSTASGMPADQTELRLVSSDADVAELSFTGSSELRVIAKAGGVATLSVETVADSGVPPASIDVTVLPYDGFSLASARVTTSNGVTTINPVSFTFNNMPVDLDPTTYLMVRALEDDVASVGVDAQGVSVTGTVKGRGLYEVYDGVTSQTFEVVTQKPIADVVFDPPTLHFDGLGDTRTVTLRGVDEDGDVVVDIPLNTFCSSITFPLNDQDVESAPIAAGGGSSWSVSSKKSPFQKVFEGTCEGASKTFTPKLLVTSGPDVRVRTGHAHTCVFKTGQTDLRCWGLNAYGQLGVSLPATAVDYVSSPVTPDISVASIEDVSLGQDSTCVLSDAGELSCFGRNNSGQLGQDPGALQMSATPVVVAQINNIPWTRVSVGANHVCAINASNHLYCWGRNSLGQLGDGSQTSTWVPKRVASSLLWSQVWSGYDHTCARTVSGRGYCWGYNIWKQLGQETQSNIVTKPLALPPIAGNVVRIREMSLGRTHTCAISQSEVLHCWGRNASYQLQTDQSFGSFEFGEERDSSKKWRAVRASDNTTCAHGDDNVLVCWGEGVFGQIGVDAAVRREHRPQVIAKIGDSFAPMFDLSPRHGCAVDESNKVFCWGYEGHGRLGNGAVGIEHLSAISPETRGMVTQLAVGARYSCAVESTAKTDQSSAQCWGENRTLRVGTTPDAVVVDDPTIVPTTPGPGVVLQSLSLMISHSCGLDMSGKAYCWGGNFIGQLGTGGPLGATMLATPVDTTEVFTSIGVGQTSTCAINASGEVFCWGDNGLGQITGLPGMTSVTPRPLQDNQGNPISERFDTLAVSRHAACATLRLDAARHDIYCWGGGFKKDGNAWVNGYEPTLFGSLPGEVIELVAGQYHFCARIKEGADDAVYCWGRNYENQSAGSDGFAMTPQKVSFSPSPSSISDLDAGFFHTCAVVQDNEGSRIWCWGENREGQLGRKRIRRETTNPRPVDVTVGGQLVTRFDEVYAGDAHTCGRTDTGQFYCWGSLSHAQLGSKLDGIESTPVLVFNEMW